MEYAVAALVLMLLMVLYLLVSIVYSMVVVHKQSKQFQQNLKPGDKTNFGKISSVNGDLVVINREPLVLRRTDVQPTQFKANRFFFLFGFGDRKNKTFPS